MTEREWLESTDPLAMLLEVTSDISEAELGPYGLPVFSLYKLTMLHHAWEARCQEGERKTIGRLFRHLNKKADDCIGLIHGAGPDDKQTACRYMREIAGNPHKPAIVLADNIKTLQSRSDGDSTILLRSGQRVLLSSITWIDPDWLAWENGLIPNMARQAYADGEKRQCEQCDGKGQLSGVGFPSLSPIRCTSCKGKGYLHPDLDPVRLAIIADALEDAGCPSLTCQTCEGRRFLGVGPESTNRKCHTCNGTGKVPNPITNHLRIHPTSQHSPRCGTEFRGCAPECPQDQWERNGPHVQGCWVIDMLLGNK